LSTKICIIHIEKDMATDFVIFEKGHPYLLSIESVG